MIGRWIVALLLALAALPAAAEAIPQRPAPAALDARRAAEDFDAAWRAIETRYAYFDRHRAAARRVRGEWRPKALRARSRAELLAALEGSLAALHDEHVTLSEHTTSSPRRVPLESDIWASWKNGAAVVEAVRTFGDADVAGLRPGQQVASVAGAPVERAVRERLGPANAGDADRDWALRQLLAGPRNGLLRMEVTEGSGKRSLEIERKEAPPSNGPPLIARRMGEERDLGYIRMKHGLGHARFVEHFDAALHYLKDTRALILDLREVSEPGHRDATLAILGRFTAAPAPWQQRELPDGKRIVDSVAPRGDTYRAPLLVLVDRWTAGEGEALAAGLVAVAKARLVGTPMAGLRGELAEVKLPHTGLVLRFPAQKVLHVDGTPRERLQPAIAVDLASPKGGPGDPILYQALKALEKR